jgi:hypothetical protein
MLPSNVSGETGAAQTIEVSRLLYQLDREAYVEALNAARSASSTETTDAEPAGNDMEAAG